MHFRGGRGGDPSIGSWACPLPGRP